MAAYGSTWETFTPVRGNESHSHAWSAHPVYHLMQTIGGITQTAPAWKTIRFAPVFEGEHGGADIPSPAGKISARWTRRPDARIDFALRLPRGISAEIVLPGQPPIRLSASRKWHGLPAA